MRVLNTRAIVFFLAVFAVISSIGGGYLYFNTLAGYALEKAHADDEKKLELLRALLSAQMDLRQNEVKSLAGLAEAKLALSRPHPAASARANRLFKHFQQILEAEACYLMDRAGNTISASNYDTSLSSVGKSYGFRPYFKTAIKGRPGIYMARGVTSKTRGIYFSAPVYVSGSAEVAGVMVLKVKSDPMQAHLARFKDGLAVLVNPKGLIFTASRKKYIFKLLWKLSSDELKKMAASRQFGTADWQWSGFVRKGQNIAVDAAGNEYAMHQTYMPKLPGWKIIFFHDLAEVTEKVFDDSFRLTRYIGLGICLAIGLLAFFLWRQAHLNISRREQMTEALRESEERFRGAFEAAAIGLALVGLDGRWLKVNKTLSDIVGYGKDELMEMKFQALTHPDDLKIDLDRAAKLVAGEISTYQLEKRYLHKEGHPIWVMLSVSLVRNAKGEPHYFVSQVIDITERKKMEQQLQAVSVTDLLTGLLNRRGFMEQAARQLRVADRLEGEIYLFYADLDNLKTINDRLGHDVGDQALGETADILRRTFRQSDVISRIGGDEFAVLLTTRKTDDASAVTVRFEDQVATANRTENRVYIVGISFGIVKQDQSTPHTIAELLSQADALMYRHKNKRKKANA